MTSTYFDFLQRKNPFRGGVDSIHPIQPTGDPTQPTAGSSPALPTGSSGGLHPVGRASSPPLFGTQPKLTADRTAPNDLSDPQYVKFFDGANGPPPPQYAALAQQNKTALATPASQAAQERAVANGDSLQWDSLHDDWYAPSHPGDTNLGARGGPDYGHKPDAYGAGIQDERRGLDEARMHLLEGFGQGLTGYQSPALIKLNAWNNRDQQTPWGW